MSSSDKNNTGKLNMNDALRELYESLNPYIQSGLAALLGVIAHADEFASLLAIAVIAYQLKTAYYKSKREKAAFEKETNGQV